jgi:hypothetical protein
MSHDREDELVEISTRLCGAQRPLTCGLRLGLVALTGSQLPRQGRPERTGGCTADATPPAGGV